MFDPALFKQAFVDAGVWILGSVTVEASPPVDVFLGFTEPQEMIIEGSVVGTGYLIEYETNDLPRLMPGHLVSIADPGTGQVRSFRVSQPAQKKGNGFFSVAELEQLS